MKHQPVKQGQTTTPGTPCPTLYDKCVGSLNRHKPKRMTFIVFIMKQNAYTKGSRIIIV